MNAECKASRLKKRKKVEGLGKGENVDLISKLPDSILHHILSFLQTDLAVSTSILSKRWKHLWISTTSLDFDSGSGWSEKAFSRFIKGVLLYHSSKITRFNLTCDLDLNPTLVESWICAALQRQVEEISLSQPLLSLPDCLCTSKILKVLKAESNFNLSLPSTIWLPSLKILHLESVGFVDDLSIGRLFSGLPCIEELTIAQCRWGNVKSVVVSLPTLLTLKYSCMYNKDGGVVNINAENLLNLNCQRDLDVDLQLNTMPLLAHADVHVYRSSSLKVNAKVIQRATNLFGALCFAKSLHITGESLECLGSCYTSRDVNLVPMFVNLTSLKVDSKFSRSAAALLSIILQNAALLESLVIAAKICDGTFFMLSLPDCLCTSKILKVLKVDSNCNLSLPSMISFPSLKILHLESVRFVEDFFVRLFFGLPCIEELTIAECEWGNVKNVVISLPTLLTFKYSYMYGRGGVVNINAENLLNLDCQVDLDVDCIMNTMPSLSHAEIHVCNSSCSDEMNAKVIKRATNIFGALCFAKSLHISGESLECLDFCSASKGVKLVPMFVRLTTLKVDCEISRFAAALLKTILQNAPLLESLVIAGRVNISALLKTILPNAPLLASLVIAERVFGVVTWSSKPYLQCIEFSLRKCSLLSFYGGPADIGFVKFLLRNAKALKELKIQCFSYKWTLEKFEDIKNELESVCRASECCVVEFLKPENFA